MRALLVGLWASTALAFPIEVLRDAGPSSNRIDIVVMGDGYTAADQAQLTNDANVLVNQLFNTPPWREYAGLFNVKLIKVVSNETGADQGSFGAMRDTALGAYYFCQGIERLLCLSSSAVYSTLAAHTPEYDVILVTVNDPKYGGAGGPYAVSSIASQARDIIIHELGHTVANLADEYESPYPGYPMCGADCTEANVTTNATSTVKWSPWILSGTPIPTPGGTPGVGVFQGGRYVSSGVYRPTSGACLMRSIFPSYCSVCTEQLVKSFHQRFSAFDVVSPSSATVAECVPARFDVLTVSGLSTRFQASWSLDGGSFVDAGVLDAGTTFIVSAPVGNHTVRLALHDNTSLVRRDPSLMLRDLRNMPLTVTPVCGAPAACQLRQCLLDGGCVLAPAPDGQTCLPAQCTGDVLQLSSVCAGGSCPVRSTVQCAPYSCDTGTTACRTSCASSLHCAAGFACNGVACAPVPDAGAVDSGTAVDAGVGDAGSDAGARFDAGTPDAGVDAGTPFDAGTDAGTPDAGTPDAGPRDAGAVDAGSDGGVPDDAGVPDAGASDDAGTDDAGVPDAGVNDDAGTDDAGADAGDDDAGNDDAGAVDSGTVTTTPDAGLTTDGGLSEPPIEAGELVLGGCGCTSAFSMPLWGVLLMLHRRRSPKHVSRRGVNDARLSR